MMADFFTRLAERSMGLTAGVRPDYPAAMSPARGGETFADGPAPFLAPAVPGMASPGSIAPAVPEPKPRPRMNFAQQAFDQSPGRSTPADDAHDRPAESQHAIATVPLPAQRQSRDANQDVPVQAREFSEKFSETILAPDANTVVAPVQREAADATGAAPLSRAPAPQWRPAAPPQAPTVQVTIGRVEIRAVTPPTISTARPAERPVAARLSLDEYLRQRNEGRR